jgi:hypothetical protein
LFGDADPLTIDWQRRVAEWQRYFERVSSHAFEGAGHYFVHSDPAALAQVLLRELEL